MRVITVIQAKGGCGKSTIAISLAAALAAQSKNRVLLIDLDPQAQLTEWLGLGDGLHRQNTIAAVFLRETRLHDVIQPTNIPGLDFVAGSQPLEAIGHALANTPGRESVLAEALDGLPGNEYGHAVIDSPNQISPIMENAVLAADTFVIPFESTKAVTAYANLYQLIQRLRSQKNCAVLHVLNNVGRPGLRKAVLEAMRRDGIEPAPIEVRGCGWLAKVDHHGGSILHYRPRSRGAHDVQRLAETILSIERGTEP